MNFVSFLLPFLFLFFVLSFSSSSYLTNFSFFHTPFTIYSPIIHKLYIYFFCFIPSFSYTFSISTFYLYLFPEFVNLLYVIPSLFLLFLYTIFSKFTNLIYILYFLIQISTLYLLYFPFSFIPFSLSP